MTREAKPKEPRAQARNGRREQRPSFQFYPQDFLASDSVAQMTPAEVGHFMLLLCRSWVGPGLPADRDRLARLMGVSRAECDELMAGPLGDCWEERDGRLWNARQERERQVAEERSAARRAAGSLGGRAKAESAACQSDAVAEPPSLRSNATPLLEQSDSKGDGMGWDGMGVSGEGCGEVAPPVVARAAAKELEPVPPEVQRALDRWGRHRAEIGKPLGASSVRALLGVGRRDPPAFARRVEASIASGTTVLLEDRPAAANGQRLTARQQDQRRAHDQGKAWEALLEGAIEKGLSAAPATRAVAVTAPSSRGAPDAAQAKPGALDGAP